MQIIAKNIRRRALMETYQTAKFDRSPKNLSRVNGPVSGKKRRKKKKEKEKHKQKICRSKKYHAGLELSRDKCSFPFCLLFVFRAFLWSALAFFKRLMKVHLYKLHMCNMAHA